MDKEILKRELQALQDIITIVAGDIQDGFENPFQPIWPSLGRSLSVPMDPEVYEVYVNLKARFAQDYLLILRMQERTIKRELEGTKS